MVRDFPDVAELLQFHVKALSQTPAKNSALSRRWLAF